MTKINLETVRLTANKLEVSCSSTIYINLPFIVLPELKEMNNLLKEVRSLAKERGVTIQRAGNKKYLDSIKQEYPSLKQLYNDQFDMLHQLWKDKVNKGIYAPTSDDTELKEMSQIKWNIEGMFYRSQPLYRVQQLYRELTEIKEELLSDSGLVSIAL
jgi:hypothetical protein